MNCLDIRLHASVAFRSQTLSLLCATLSWQQAYGAALDLARAHRLSPDHADAPASPTHSGGAQDTGELEHTRSILKRASGMLRLPEDRRAAPSLRAVGFHREGIRLPGQQYAYADGPGRQAPTETCAAANALPKRASTIVYSSRTHSQLVQVVKELKASAFKPRTAVLGSREQLCVHPTISRLSGATQGNACKSTCKSRSCSFRSNLNAFLDAPNSAFDLPHAHWTSGQDRELRLPSGRGQAARRDGASAPHEAVVQDIEDLVTMGRSKEVCPYFAMRDDRTLAAAELVLMPYNYLLDATVRRTVAVDWFNAVIIFDEGHNIESVAANAASFDLSTLDISRCVTEMTPIVKLALEAAAGPSPDPLQQAFLEHFDAESCRNVPMMKGVFLEIEAHLCGMELPPGS